MIPAMIKQQTNVGRNEEAEELSTGQVYIYIYEVQFGHSLHLVVCTQGLTLLAGQVLSEQLGEARPCYFHFSSTVCMA